MTQVFLLPKDTYAKSLKSLLTASKSLFEQLTKRNMSMGYEQQKRQNQRVTQFLFRVFIHLADGISLYNTHEDMAERRGKSY